MSLGLTECGLLGDERYFSDVSASTDSKRDLVDDSKTLGPKRCYHINTVDPLRFEGYTSVKENVNEFAPGLFPPDFNKCTSEDEGNKILKSAKHEPGDKIKINFTPTEQLAEDKSELQLIASVPYTVTPNLYGNQVIVPIKITTPSESFSPSPSPIESSAQSSAKSPSPVSYTHLTLPTN